MDANYLKQTVGPLLASALSALITYGYDSTSSGPRGFDAITFIGEYLLHHDKSQKKIEEDHKRRAELQAIKEAAIAAEHADREQRRRFEEEIKGRMAEILEKERKVEEERQRARAAEAVELEKGVAAATSEGGQTVEKPETETRSGIPEPIQEGEEEDEGNTEKVTGAGEEDSASAAPGVIAEENEDEED